MVIQAPPNPGNHPRFIVEDSQNENGPSHEGPFSVDFVVEQLGNSPSNLEGKEEAQSLHPLCTFGTHALELNRAD